MVVRALRVSAASIDIGEDASIAPKPKEINLVPCTREKRHKFDDESRVVPPARNNIIETNRNLNKLIIKGI